MLTTSHKDNGWTGRTSQVLQSAQKPKLITSMIDAKECQDVGTCDRPNACAQTKMYPTDKHGDRIIMKNKGFLFDILCEFDNVYNDIIVWEKYKKQSYIHMYQ